MATVIRRHLPPTRTATTARLCIFLLASPSLAEAAGCSGCVRGGCNCTEENGSAGSHQEPSGDGDEEARNFNLAIALPLVGALVVLVYVCRSCELGTAAPPSRPRPRLRSVHFDDGNADGSPRREEDHDDAEEEAGRTEREEWLRRYREAAAEDGAIPSRESAPVRVHPHQDPPPREGSVTAVRGARAELVEECLSSTEIKDETTPGRIVALLRRPDAERRAEATEGDNGSNERLGAGEGRTGGRESGGRSTFRRSMDFVSSTLRSLRSGRHTCAVCLEGYAAGQTLAWAKEEGCTHIFHKGCIFAWLLDHDECPLCRAVVAVPKDPEG